MSVLRCKTAGGVLLAVFLLLLIPGCVAWVDRPPPPELAPVEPVGVDAATLTVVRKKQYALAGVTMTLYIDDIPAANLEAGEYVQLQVTPGERRVAVRWDIGGLNILGGGPGGGGYIRDPVQTYSKEIIARCTANANCFITIATRAFASREEERVTLDQAERLEGDFSLQDKTAVSPRLEQSR